VSAWLDAVRRTAWIPPAFARYDLSLDEAALRLRVPREVVERLVDAGLPAGGQADGGRADGGQAGPRVDANDVFNLALELRWHATLPVTGFRGALRWLRQPLPALVEAQDWHCEFTAPLLPAGAVLAARPSPETYGGVWRPEGEQGEHATPPAVEPGRMLVAPGRTVCGVASLRGRHTPIRSAVVRERVRAVLDSGHRWAKLPLALQTRPDLVSSLGYATCVSISLSLSAAVRAAGFQTRTRRGFLIAPVATGHSWVEVLDEDGEWKVIDPVLVLLHRRLVEVEPAGHTAATAPEQNLADGLLVNRVLASALPADAPLAVDGDGAAVELAAAFRKAPRIASAITRLQTERMSPALASSGDPTTP
jgi:hypothetical protein